MIQGKNGEDGIKGVILYRVAREDLRPLENDGARLEAAYKREHDR